MYHTLRKGTQLKFLHWDSGFSSVKKKVFVMLMYCVSSHENYHSYIVQRRKEKENIEFCCRRRKGKCCRLIIENILTKNHRAGNNTKNIVLQISYPETRHSIWYTSLHRSMSKLFLKSSKEWDLKDLFGSSFQHCYFRI